MAKSAKTVYEPSVPKDHALTDPGEINQAVRIQAFMVGQSIESASLNLRQVSPGWAAFFDKLWYQMNDIFGVSE